MRGRRVVILGAVLALALMTVVGPTSAATRAPTGDRIDVMAGDTEYPAGTPFFVRHGVASDPSLDRSIGRSRFVLEVDGVPQAPAYQEWSRTDGLLVHAWVFNFPAGMTGVHTLTGHWLAACGVASAYLPCGDGGRRELVEFEALEIVVTFTD